MPRLNLIALVKKNPRLRYSLIVALVAVLAAVLIHDRLNVRERIVAAQTVDCPALEQGCRIALRDSSYLVRSDAAIEQGKPFQLTVEGQGVGVAVRVFWRTASDAAAAGHTRLQYAGPDRWQASMQLPPGPQRDWVLHLEINARAVDIRTRVR